MNPPPPLNLEKVGNLIRYWVNYDNKITALNKETKAAREVKNNYEAQIIKMIRESNMTNPVIQTGGGRILIGEDKHTAPLTFTNLETMLHQYYAKKPGAHDETTEIIKFIRLNRESSVSPCLKRQGAPRSRSVE
jgi:Family of unknown function (DUF5760)